MVENARNAANMKEYAPDAPEPRSVGIPVQDQYFVACLDVDRQDAKAIAQVGLVKTDIVQPKRWVALVFGEELASYSLKGFVLVAPVIMPAVRDEEVDLRFVGTHRTTKSKHLCM